jgi:hypothetical protein
LKLTITTLARLTTCGAIQLARKSCPTKILIKLRQVTAKVIDRDY